MFNDFAKGIIRFKLFATEPVTFTHKEWEVADVLVSLELIAFKELIFTEIHEIVEVFVEASPVGFFALFKSNTVFNTKADKVDGSK